MANVLLAEDSPTQVVMLRALLEEEDAHVVRVAEDGQIAFDLIESETPDVVVTDMQMPNVDGLQLVQKIRKDYSHIPVILIATEGSEELAAEALREGAAAFLPKTSVGEELLNQVEHVLYLMQTDVCYKNLIDRLDYNEFQFTLDNDPTQIAPLVNLMQQMSAGMQLCDDVTRARIGMAIEQALLNALYHGNLEISHQDQVDDEELQVEGSLALVDRRRTEPDFRDRQIHFKAHLTQQELTFVIRDDGKGFDTTSYRTAGSIDALDIEGGRGLSLIRSFMDEVRFNDVGNEITMIKRR